MVDQILRDKGGLLSPIIRKIQYRGQPALLKDFRSKNLLARAIVGPSLVNREFRILRRLEGIPGIPRVHAVLDGAALVMEFIEGRTLSKFRAGDLPERVFHELRKVVDAMHARGVIHLDLRQKKNIIITDDLHPYVLDFAGAWAPGPGSVLRMLSPGIRRVDESALLKMKQRGFPELLSPRDREAIDRHRFWRKFWIFTRRGKYVR